MRSGGAGQTLRGHAFRDWAPVPLRASARALIDDKSLPPCASVTGPLQCSAPRASAPCSVQHPAPQHPAGYSTPRPSHRPRPPAAPPFSAAARPSHPCRWPPPTMRTRVAPRAPGSPSTATTRPAAASSPPITSGEGTDRRVGRGWGLPGPRLRRASPTRRHHGQRPRTRPHPGDATEPAAPVCCAPVPTPAPHPGAHLEPRDVVGGRGGMGQPPLFLGRPPAPGVSLLCGFQVLYLFPTRQADSKRTLEG